MIEDLRFRVFEGKKGRLWFVADEPNAADHIYLFEPADAGKPDHSRGMGGASLMFTTTDGEELSVKAPWHSNAHALREDTGIDYRRKYRTRITVSGGSYKGEDQWPGIDVFDRGEWEAQGMANVCECPMTLHKVSANGSSTTTIYPVDDGEFAYHWVEGIEEYPLERYQDFINQMDKEGRWQGNPKHPKYPWKEGS